MSRRKKKNNNNNNRKKNNKEFDVNSLIGKRVIACKFGCETMLVWNNEFQLYQEQWSDRIHNKNRCEYIKAKRRSESNDYNPKIAREHIVMELREVIDDLAKGTEIVKKMYYMIKSRKSKDQAVTAKELAMALHPTKVLVDYEGNKQPTSEAMNSVTYALSRLRKGDYKGIILAYSIFFDEYGQFRYYNIQERDDFKSVKDRQLKQTEGILRGLDEAEYTLAKAPEDRLKEEQELDKTLEYDPVGAYDKKRRRKKGSGGGNN